MTIIFLPAEYRSWHCTLYYCIIYFVTVYFPLISFCFSSVFSRCRVLWPILLSHKWRGEGSEPQSRLQVRKNCIIITIANINIILPTSILNVAPWLKTYEGLAIILIIYHFLLCSYFFPCQTSWHASRHQQLIQQPFNFGYHLKVFTLQATIFVFVNSTKNHCKPLYILVCTAMILVVGYTNHLKRLFFLAWPMMLHTALIFNYQG